MAETPHKPTPVTVPNAAGPRPAAARPVWRRSLSSARRWARDTFSREQLFASLKSLLWVAPLTALIWVWAEREQLSAIDGVSLVVEVKSSDPRQVVSLLEPSDRTVKADLSGPRARLDTVGEKLEPRAGSPPLGLEVDRALGPGVHYIETAPVGNNVLFTDNGVSVSNVQPRQLKIQVDVLEDVELEVRAPAKVANRLSNVVFDPPRVKVTVPRAVLLGEPDKAPGSLFVEADLAALQPGPHVGISVAVKALFPGPNVTVTPGKVKATLDVKQADVRHVMESIPVFVLAPGMLQKLFVVEYDLTIFSVPVYGPAELIDQLLEGTLESEPRAVFEVPAAAEPGGAEHTAPLRYELPQGIYVKPEEAPRTVTFRLLTRSEAGE